MFTTKICGITTIADAQLAAAAGADAIGLNFYFGSKRYLEPSAAGEIVAALPTEVSAVGVFVNSPAAEVCRWFDQLALRFIQLHGDEPPEYLRELGARPVIHALRLGPDGIEPLEAYLARAAELGSLPAAVLIDGFAPGDYGGTGTSPDWHQLSEPRPWLRGLPLVLAGGLRPDNVGAAIRQVHPAAVDTASGVESVAPHKDPTRVREFVSAARAAFADLKA